MPNDDIPFKMFVFEGKDGNYVRDKHWHRSIGEIALNNGFPNSKAFAKVFKKRYEMLPSEYRRGNAN